MTEEFDLVVIGAGPGGYVAAIRAAQLGMKVACVEKEKSLGGTCLNVGCIPSKALLDSSELFQMSQQEFESHGIKVNAMLDLDRMMKRKVEIVKSLTMGIQGLFKKNKVSSFMGLGSVKSADTVSIIDSQGKETLLKTKKILLATGSVPVSIPAFPIDEKRIVSSTGALSFPEVPGHLVVIGGGVIGLELGSVWHRLGAKVTVIEFLDRLLPGMDRDCSKLMLQILKKEGIEIHLQTKVESVSYVDDCSLKVQATGKSTNLEIDCDTVLVAVGRRPFSEGLGLQEAGIEKDERGFVKVDSHFQTNVNGIYAIGDLIEGPMLAHKAEEDGVACVEGMAGMAVHHDYSRVPSVVYTHPEVAGVGLTEEEALEKGFEIKTAKFPFQATGRARALGETRGFVKVIAEKKKDEILGVHMIGPRVSELIAEAVLAMEYRASAEDIARTCHAHPTLSEAFREAALAVDSRAIHM
jgi:dihydrolipoamide dehydrogenase